MELKTKKLLSQHYNNMTCAVTASEITSLPWYKNAYIILQSLITITSCLQPWAVCKQSKWVSYYDVKHWTNYPHYVPRNF